MPRSGSRKCFNCKQYFLPNPRSKGRQRFCSESACRQASKQQSQQTWLNKPANQDYFKGPAHVRRVQQWRAQHPGYWKRSSGVPDKATPLQDTLTAQVTDSMEETGLLTESALQDTLIAQPFVLLGLISQLMDVALQDQIVDTLGRLQQLGEDLVYSTPGGSPHATTDSQSTAATSSAASFQLGRSPPGT